MAKNYYSNPSSTYPFMYQAILERLQIYICDLLYPDEDFAVAKNRFILANFDVGDEIGIRKSIEYFKSTNAKFPFTAYNIGDDEMVTNKSLYQIGMKYYDPALECYMNAIPAKLTINMSTYFSNAYDYSIATTKFAVDLAALTRLYVPIVINEKETQFTIDVNADVNKGNYAFAFQEMLRVGNIFDISHNLVISFNYFTLVRPSYYSEDGKQEPVTIRPVDDMVLALKQYETEELIEQVTISTIPEVISSTPTDKSINIPISSTIIINFNTPMNSDSVIANLDIVPKIEYDYVFNNSTTQLTITPWALLNNTTYNVVINISAESMLTHNLGTEFNINFTTIL